MKSIGYKGEIGSEFWQCELTTNSCKSKYKNIRYLQSGRTAIDFVIEDIMIFSTPKTALLPSYCCHTMIEPFIENGIHIVFYDVFIDETGHLKMNFPSNIECDIILIMQYFGFSQQEVQYDAELLSSTEAVIIEDVTHSMLMKDMLESVADYVIGSFRKWSGFLTGGFALKKKEPDFAVAVKPASDTYLELRKCALSEKRNYLFTENESKDFLKTFLFAEEFLEKNYKGYGMDEESFDSLFKLDIGRISNVRKNNASLLLEKLLESKMLTPIFTEVKNTDCPLSFPVIVSSGNRDKLRNFLVQKKIYCPVNWPISELHNISAQAQKIYDNELSIVCDQRYDADDMCYIAEKIYEFEDAKWD